MNLEVATALIDAVDVRPLVNLVVAEKCSRLLRANDPQHATHQLTRVFGCPFLTHLTEEDPIVSGEIQKRGFWEFPETFALATLIRPGHVFIDAGANIGYFTILAARLVGKAGMVVAFEPEARNYQTLQANVVLAGQAGFIGCKVLTVGAALSDHQGSQPLAIYEQNLGFHTLARLPQTPAGWRQVRTTTLDEFRASADVPLIDVLKSDTQGSELAILRGAEKTIASDRPILCLEIEPHLFGADHCVSLVEWLADRGYDAFRVFHANCFEPHEILREAAAWTDALGVVNQIRQGMVRQYGSLLALPAGRVGR